MAEPLVQLPEVTEAQYSMIVASLRMGEAATWAAIEQAQTQEAEELMIATAHGYKELAEKIEAAR